MLLYSVEFVLVKENLKAQEHLHNFQNNSKSATLTPLGFGILGMWICEILLCALESIFENPRQSENLNLCLSLLAFTMGVCVIFFELVELVGYSKKNCYGSFHR